MADISSTRAVPGPGEPVPTPVPARKPPTGFVDQLIGADGTQDPPPLPWRSDPLSGLVTGELFVLNPPGVGDGDPAVWIPEELARYIDPANSRRRAVRRPATRANVRLPGTPVEIAPAGAAAFGRPLPQRPTATASSPYVQALPVSAGRGAPGFATPTYIAPARGTASRPAAIRPTTPRARPAGRTRRRRAGAGRAVFFILVVLVFLAILFSNYFTGLGK
ncbi:MAG TPA: hypothetical protein VHW44_07115 [Pseudonocardiaceae bacterium]|nr:hypothetical protein [Pseudonocardiaceae bacterium]